jgi:hypothetical protein
MEEKRGVFVRDERERDCSIFKDKSWHFIYAFAIKCPAPGPILLLFFVFRFSL